MIIAEEYRKESILHNLRSTCGTGISSLKALISSDETESAEEALFSFAQQLRNHADQYAYYGNMFSYPAFFREVLSFAESLALYGISSDALPEDDASRKELKEIVSKALLHTEKERRTRLSAEAFLHREHGSTVLSYGFYRDYFWYELSRKLKEKMTYEPYPACEVQKRTYSTALSMRREIEGIAQRIIAENVPCNVILCSPSSQMPVLRAVFERCGIPFSYVSDTIPVRLPSAFASLVRLAINRDADSLLEALLNDAFSESISWNLYEYLKSTMTECAPPHLYDAFVQSLNKVHARRSDPPKPPAEAAYLKQMEEEADRLFENITPSLNLLLNAASGADILKAAYTVCSSSALLKQAAERTAGLRLRSALQKCLPLAESAEDAVFLAEQLAFTLLPTSAFTTSFCTVSDLTHPVDPQEVTYICGCASTAYPGFQPMGGIFDEEYVRSVDAYPSLKERRDSYMEQLSWIQASGTQLRFSCYTNDSQGREIFPAYEITSMPSLQKEGLMACAAGTPAQRPAHRLMKETAQKLFTRTCEDGGYFIRGSISSVESWFSCPYRYFIASGLHVRKPDALELSPASIGNIQHAFMENAIQKDDGSIDPEYAANIDEPMIRSLIHPFFEAMAVSHPYEAELISISEDRMTESLLRSASFLACYEKNTRMKPLAAEKHFEDFAISEHVRLRGTIDRINRDDGNHMISVLDYKSSAKDLNEKKAAQGLQLQLLSYLLTAASMFPDDEAGGTYYFSMKDENISSSDVPAAKINRNGFKLTVNDPRFDTELKEELKDASRRLSGWRFTEKADALDGSGKYLKGLKNRYSINAVTDCLQACYEYFASQLLSDAPQDLGIRVAPVKEACTFCDFRRICRFHGDERTPDTVFEDSLKLKEVKPE